MSWVPIAGGSASTTTGAGTTQIAVAAGAAVSVGDTVWLAVAYDVSAGATGSVVTDSLGNTYTLAASAKDAANNEMLDVYASVVTHAGTPTVTVKYEPTPGTTQTGGGSLNVDPFTGSDAASALDGTGAAQAQATPTTGTDALTSGTWATTTDGDAIYTATVDSATGNNPGAVGTGFSALGTSAFVVLKTAWKVQTTHSATTAGTWTAAVSEAHVTAAAAMTPASGGATAPKHPVHLIGRTPNRLRARNDGGLAKRRSRRRHVLTVARIAAAAPLAVSPSAASSSWVVPSAAVSVGGVTQTPAPAISSWTALAPSVNGDVTVQPAPAASTWVVPTPSVSGAVSVQPTAAVASWTALDPAATLGTLPRRAPVHLVRPRPRRAATRTRVIVRATVQPPSAAQTVTPGAAVSTWTVPSAGVSLGGVTQTPAPAVATWAVLAPSTSGAATRTPSPAVTTWTANAPSTAWAITCTPASAAATWNVPAPASATGSVSVAAAVAVATWTANAPSVSNDVPIPPVREPTFASVTDTATFATAVDTATFVTLTSD